MAEIATGRPSTYTQEIGDAICARLIEGQSVREICRDEAMPAPSTVYLWASKNEVFSEQYAKARTAQQEHWADEIVEIADDGTNDWMERRDDKGGTAYVTNGEHLNRSRLRVDTRKWLMSKLAPKKYGDKTTIAGDPDAPLVEPSDPREVAKAVLAVLQSAIKPDEPPET